MEVVAAGVVVVVIDTVGAALAILGGDSFVALEGNDDRETDTGVDV